MPLLLRHLAGYTVGIAIFVVGIPAVLVGLARMELPLAQAPILPFGGLHGWLALPLFGVGLLFMLWSNLDLLWRGKGGPADFAGVAISPRTRRLATGGSYRYSRNPMVFGANTAYLAIALYLNAWGPLLGWLLFATTVVRYAVATEERRLLADFGDDYRRYRARTSKYIPWPPKRSDEP